MRWFVLLGVVAGAAAPTLHLKVGPAPLRVGTPVPIVVSGPFSSVRAEAVSPSGRVSPVAVTPTGRHRWRGVFRFDRTGRWRVQAFAEDLKVQVAVLIRPALPTPPPEGFGPLGRPGCNPPSPRDATADVFGTTVGGRFSGRFFLPEGAAWASERTASIEGVLGKTNKIAFVFSAGFPARFFYAVAPDGSREKPVRMEQSRGTERLAQFVFNEVGCWRIHAARGKTSGNIFVDVRS